MAEPSKRRVCSSESVSPVASRLSGNSTRVIWVPDDRTERCTSPACGRKFSLYWRRHHCRNCGKIYCDTCCGTKQPSCRIPAIRNVRRERKVRVCNSCASAVNNFDAALEAGDIKAARRIFKKGRVSVTGVKDRTGKSPIHLATMSGCLTMVQWVMSVMPSEANISTTDTVSSVLQIAAKGRHWDIVRWLVVNKRFQVKQITDINVLHDLLDMSFTAPRTRSEECVVCLEHCIDTAIVPCGHVCCCHACARLLKACPICRQSARSTLQLFFTGEPAK